MHFSCEQKINWIDYKEIDIVRTSRDTTYYYDGELLNGKIKKFDDKGNCKLEFNVKNGILNGNFIEYYNDGNVKLKSNYNRGKLDGKYISYFINKNINQETYYKRRSNKWTEKDLLVKWVYKRIIRIKIRCPQRRVYFLLF